MRHLFKTLFGHERETVCYPEDFVRDSIERAVDGTDPWLRGLSGYRRKLRPAVVRALGYAADLCDALDDPLALQHEQWGDDPRLHAFFVSEERLCTLLQTHPALVAFRQGLASSRGGSLYGLMRMDVCHQTFMGVDKVQGVMTRGVKQTLVSFKGHQFLDLCTDSGEVRRLYKQRVFDHLVRLALNRLAMASGLRKELEDRSKLLHAKMQLLKRGQWGLDLDGSKEPPRREVLTEQLEEIELLLKGVGSQNDYLDRDLSVVTELLSEPEKYLWLARETMVLDRDGILRANATADLPEFTFQQAHNDEGWSMAISLVEIPPIDACCL